MTKMRIGLDFDNTIINYDGVFYKVAVEVGYIVKSARVTKTKQGVRDYLRTIGAEDNWTTLQGLVYGKKIFNATPYPGAIEVIGKLIGFGHEIYIISHKTRRPFLGPKYDLHAAAHDWLNVFLRDDEGQLLISADHIYFNETLEQKLSKIASKGCDVFLDDLIEVLTHSDFPNSARKVFFNPNQILLSEGADITSVKSWQNFMNFCDVT